ncbi:unnamed protein product [Nesidiocoris tenuis]|uniref:Lysophospholipid acyltransferase 5 n=1 Tax=Nesidiocoris tenuis TaxID=355587 RepID=A0A6H5HG68_9HEMI|nr:unnamed protein product [Nesidiocoris tenuis]
MDVEKSLLGSLANAVGIGEPALKLLLSILFGYPIAIVYRTVIVGKPPAIQHAYMIACGLLLGFYNFGYCYTSTDSYDIVWTMPHCILTLRLTGLAFDLYDGSLPEDKLSNDQKKVVLREVPSLLEMAGYTYFPTSFLVGPQFPMKKYQDFIGGKFHGANVVPSDNLEPAIRRLMLGLFYAGLHTVGASYYSDDYLFGDEYAAMPLWKRIWDLGMWGHFVLYKYITIWLFCEGSCILIGIAYNGKNEKGESKWDGSANVKLLLFETAQNFNSDYISAFNINTNYWMLQYIYKRLKFLGNKYYSQLGVLVYLALWHGLHSGYYMCFFMEFISVMMEKELEVILKRNEFFLERLQDPVASKIKWVVLKLYTLIFMGPCILPLAVLKFDKWWLIYSRTYFYAHLFWGGWILYKPLVKKLLPPRRDKRE